MTANAPRSLLRPMLPFMKLADIGLFARSAKTDARIRAWWSDGSAALVFDRAYESAPENDPWASASPRFRYQHRKYDTIASLIPKGRYRRALDLGCGTGLFTERLAGIADEVVGVDVSAIAVDIAKRRTSAIENLSFSQCDVLELPSAWDGSFDLITVLDTLYYLPPPIDDQILKAVADRLSRLVSPQGLVVVANHYVFSRDGDSRMTRRIHDAFRWCPGFQPAGQYRRPFYLVTLLRGQRAALTTPYLRAAE
jgi:SAM-dependent methyltransferase